MDNDVIKEIKQEHKGTIYNFLFGVLAENVETDATHRFITDKQLTDMEKKPGPNSALDNNTVNFTVAEDRENIQPREKLKTIFGKIAKWLNDLKTAAFCDSTQSLAVTEPGTVLDGRVGKTINDKFGGLRFYEDATGKYVVGADSVPKKLGSTRQGEWMVVAEEWFCDLSGPNKHFVENGGYIMDQKGWRWTLAKDYDIKALRGDYAQLTMDDFVFKITSVLYFIDNMGHDHDSIELPGPSVHAYDPATGKLTVKSDICNLSSGDGSELVSMKIKIMICA